MKTCLCGLAALVLIGSRLLPVMAGTDHRAMHPHNPVLCCGASGEWDAGALGSMTILKVGELFHMYCEGWGIRENSAVDYNTLQIGHAMSRDGLWLICFGPDGHFDQKGCDIRLAIYQGPHNIEKGTP